MEPLKPNQPTLIYTPMTQLGSYSSYFRAHEPDGEPFQQGKQGTQLPCQIRPTGGRKSPGEND